MEFKRIHCVTPVSLKPRFQRFLWLYLQCRERCKVLINKPRDYVPADGVQVVGGSNPLAPTKSFLKSYFAASAFFFAGACFAVGMKGDMS